MSSRLNMYPTNRTFELLLSVLFLLQSVDRCAGGYSCVPNDSTSNTELCWSLKWHCHDPNANAMSDGILSSCGGTEWQTIGCCYAGDYGAGCSRESLLVDATEIYTEWYHATDQCPENVAVLRMLPPPGTCIATDASSPSNVEICWSLKWHCHDPNANAMSDGRLGACENNEWQTVSCCYGGDNGAACSRESLLVDATEIYTEWYHATGQCTDGTFQPEEEEEDDTPPTTDAGAGGDPHFKTRSGVRFDFHGQCDLILFSSPNFVHGLGLDIHIRTKARHQYSFIESAAVKLGDDIFEVGSWGEYWFNGVDSATLPTTMSHVATVVHQKQTDKRQHIFVVELDKDTKIIIKTFKDMVSVALDSSSSGSKITMLDGMFQDGVGLLGSGPQGKMMARDGITIMMDANAHGQEWQVTNDEPKLFQVIDNIPQFPASCVMPPVETGPVDATGRRRLMEKGSSPSSSSSLTEEEARNACIAAHRIHDMEACIYDTMVTGDLDMAEAGGF